MVEKKHTPGMFSAIAGRYDLLNHLLSFNLDRRWRRKLVETAGTGEGSRVLDVATGTGDVAIEFAKGSRAAVIVGLDLSGRMLAVGNRKIQKKRLFPRIGLLEGDALDMPFKSGIFDVVTIAFGLRNLPDYKRGLEEMVRVLRPGGRLLVLEFFPPRSGFFLEAYRLYLGTILPVTGRVMSGSSGAYRYLASSIKEFMSRGQLERCLKNAGLTGIRSRRLSGGIVDIYHGVKA